MIPVLTLMFYQVAWARNKEQILASIGVSQAPITRVLYVLKRHEEKRYAQSKQTTKSLFLPIPTAFFP